MQLLDAANAFAEFGFVTFPCFGVDKGQCGCGRTHEDNPGSKGKHPAVNGWQTRTFQDSLEIIEQFESNTPLNIAIDCRRSRLAVLDIDPRSGGLDSLERLLRRFPGLSLSETVGSSTGKYGEIRGRHFYFKWPEGVKLPANLSRHGYPGIDIKTNGYVIAPPSNHVSGVSYQWIEGSDPAHCAILSFPAELTELVGKEVVMRELISVEKTLADSVHQHTQYGLRALQDEVKKVTFSREGSRNTTLFEAGLKIGSLIAGGELVQEDAINQVFSAGLKAGLDAREVERTLTRPGGAIELGMSNPRSGDEVEPEMIEWAKRRYLPRSQADSGVLLMGDILEKLNRVDWDEAFSGTPEEEWLVPGIICAGRSHAIYADAGVGKTLLMHDICAGLCSGSGVLGLSPSAPVKVLYIDHENSIHGDVVPHLREMGYNPSDLSNLVYLSFPEMAPLDSQLGGVQLEAALDAFQPDLVVLDTVSRTVSGDENSNDTWLQFYNFAGKAIKKRGMAYVRLDHIGKNSGNGMRGGSAKKGDVDLVWFLKRQGNSLNFTLTCEKSRVPIPEHNFGITRVVSPLRHVLQGNESAIDWAEYMSKSEKFDFAFGLLREELRENGSLVGQRASWEKHKEPLKKRGVSRSIHYEAHRYLSMGLDQPLSDVNDIE